MLHCSVTKLSKRERERRDFAAYRHKWGNAVKLFSYYYHQQKQQSIYHHQGYHHFVTTNLMYCMIKLLSLSSLPFSSTVQAKLATLILICVHLKKMIF